MQVRERYGDYDKALELFNTAIEFSPDNALVRYHRAKILIATKQYAVSVAVSPSASLVRKGLIDTRSWRLCCAAGAFLWGMQAAVKDLTHLRDTSPDESNVLFQLARAYRLMGEEVRFAQLLAEVRDVAPKSVAKIRKLVDTSLDADVGEEVMDEG